MNDRPAYESEMDRQKEARLIKAAFPDLIIHKLPRRYHIDYLCTHDRLAKHWVECKARNAEWGNYDGYMISLDKYLAGVRLARETQGLFWLVTGWRCGTVAVVNIGTVIPMAYHIQTAGRSDRQDFDDVEPVVLIPNSSFKVLDIVLRQ